MKILVLHEVSYEKKMVYEYQMNAELLAQKGHKVTVMDFDEAGNGIYQKKLFSRTGIANVTLESVPFLNFPLLKYVTARINHKKNLEKKLQNKEIDVVFLYSVFINGTNTVRLCKKYGVPVVYRVLDAYHLLRRNYITMVPLYFGEHFIYNHADIVCLTNDAMAEYVNNVAWKNIDFRIKILLHGVDFTFFERTTKSKELLNRYGILETDRVFLFLGTTYVFSGLDIIIERFQSIINKIPNAKLLIVGKGDLDEKLSDLIAKNNLQSSVILTGVRPYNEVPDFIKIADIALNPFFINKITANIIPIKILQYLAGGTPILCTRIRDVVNYFPEGQSGVVYADITNGDDFVEKMVDLMSNEVRLSELSENGINHIRNNFLLDLQMDKLENLLLESWENNNKK